MTFSMAKCVYSCFGHERLRGGSRNSAQRGRSQISSRSVPFVCEYQKIARVPLTDFFNGSIYSIEVYPFDE